MSQTAHNPDERTPNRVYTGSPVPAPHSSGHRPARDDHDHDHEGQEHDEHAHAHTDHDHEADHEHDHDHAHDEHDHEHGDHDHDHEHEHGGGPLAAVLGLFGLGHGHSHGSVQVDSALEGSEEGIRAIRTSLIILGATAAFQLVIAVISGSAGLLADTVHNVA